MSWILVQAFISAPTTRMWEGPSLVFARLFDWDLIKVSYIAALKLYKLRLIEYDETNRQPIRSILPFKHSQRILPVVAENKVNDLLAPCSAFLHSEHNFHCLLPFLVRIARHGRSSLTSDYWLSATAESAAPSA